MSKTIPEIKANKVRNSSAPLVMVTAYDYPSAVIVENAGVDMVLVGDSVANTVLGQPDTLSISLNEIGQHVEAVGQALKTTVCIADMPWMTYHVSPEKTVENAAYLIRRGANAVKVEGGKKRVQVIRAILDCEIPVMGHIGLTPQSINAFGGYRVQGKGKEAAKTLIDDAKSLEDAGCFAIVLECIPRSLAKEITEVLNIPTIGIGAGPDCDGQVLVFHDLLGLRESKPAKFVRQYANLNDVAIEAVKNFVSDVRKGAFPNDEESYH